MSVPIEWQDATTLLITLGAIVYLVRKLAGTFGPTAQGCAKGCSSCPNSSTNPSPSATGAGPGLELVQIGLPGGAQKRRNSQASPL